MPSVITMRCEQWVGPRFGYGNYGRERGFNNRYERGSWDEWKGQEVNKVQQLSCVMLLYLRDEFAITLLFILRSK
jgi:hypothetical protein